MKSTLTVQDVRELKTENRATANRQSIISDIINRLCHELHVEYTLHLGLLVARRRGISTGQDPTVYNQQLKDCRSKMSRIRSEIEALQWSRYTQMTYVSDNVKKILAYRNTPKTNSSD